MSDKVKLQIYVTSEAAEAWKKCADKEGVNLSSWVSSRVLQARLFGTTLKNLHDKVDRLLDKETR